MKVLNQRRVAIISLIAVWFIFCSVCDARQGSENRPHIVLVMADDQGWGQTGYYGHPFLKTPHLDEMAAHGLRLDRFYAGGPVCSPTRATVLTGRTHERTGVMSHGYPLRLQEKTVAQLFDEEFEQLSPMPKERFDIVAYAQPVVRRDYHVQFENNFYSVPDRLIGKKVELFAHFRQIRIKFDDEIVAVHEKLTGRGKRSTKKEHCTNIAYEYMSYSKSIVKSKADSIGKSTLTVVENLLADTVIDRLRSARGIVFLTKEYSPQRIEAACARALTYGNINYPSIKAILKKNMDYLPIEEPVDAHDQYLFSFARDGSYYQKN